MHQIIAMGVSPIAYTYTVIILLIDSFAFQKCCPLAWAIYCWLIRFHDNLFIHVHVFDDDGVDELATESILHYFAGK